uniref:F-box domain-containing protein n=1 Tax=Solanum lycopersicum TaxID=4081 RepID=K4BVS7_SOLLC
MESPPPPPMKTTKRRAAATTSITGLTIDNSVLPIELIVEILIRLPVKTLLKMRSVSKSWSSLISTPEFVKAHVKFSANNREFAHHRLLSIRSGLVWWYVSRDDDSVDRPEDQTRCECDRGSELNLYVESLVSPNSP